MENLIVEWIACIEMNNPGEPEVGDAHPSESMLRDRHEEWGHTEWTKGHHHMVTITVTSPWYPLSVPGTWVPYPSVA